MTKEKLNHALGMEPCVNCRAHMGRYHNRADNRCGVRPWFMDSPKDADGYCPCPGFKSDTVALEVYARGASFAVVCTTVTNDTAALELQRRFPVDPPWRHVAVTIEEMPPHEGCPGVGRHVYFE